jgi:hypothetical protein
MSLIESLQSREVSRVVVSTDFDKLFRFSQWLSSAFPIFPLSTFHLVPPNFTPFSPFLTFFRFSLGPSGPCFFVADAGASGQRHTTYHTYTPSQERTNPLRLRTIGWASSFSSTAHSEEAERSTAQGRPEALHSLGFRDLGCTSWRPDLRGGGRGSLSCS